MLQITRLLSSAGTSPFDFFEWKRENIITTTEKGEVLTKHEDVEFPDDWSELSKRTVAQKYFRRSRTGDEKEISLKDMLTRVISFICDAGIEQKYFNKENAEIFGDELTHLILRQMGTFNSPVWFNVGVPGVEKPQGSACFINEIKDDMLSILELVKTEGLIFKEGSGSGVNLSPLRGSNERIKGGGTASGPVSFMQGYDAFANVILSGGRTRRAARMVTLDIDHPDILKFIQCKAKEEDIVKILVLGGMDPDFTKPNNAYTVVKHQSGNNSIMVTDEFMSKVQEIMHGYRKERSWNLKRRTDGETCETVSVKELFSEIAKAAHKCGDPGLQFYDTINAANTCKNDGAIVNSNPCGEFVWLPNSSCNLASLNIRKFTGSKFDTRLLKHAVRIFIIAQDILVDACGYPTKKITEQTHAYRPLGLGYSNLGGMLMAHAIPYDSKEGRAIAASITSLMTAQAYKTSTELASILKPFPRFAINKDPMENVLDNHYAATKHLAPDIWNIYKQANTIWRDVMTTGFGKKSNTGFRNAQVTLLAPTGTISWMMGCDTTGIEPDIGLKKTKKLIDGTTETYVNQSVGYALAALGYEPDHRKHLVEYVNTYGHLEGSSLKPEHLPIFDCAHAVHKRRLSIDAHLDMVAAVQPFLSGAISKTFNMDHDATVKDISMTFLKAWEKKIKCVSVYRDRSKMSEPMRVKEVLKEFNKPLAERRRLPDDRDSKTHRFTIAGQAGYLTVGFYPDGRIGEIFLRMAEHGSTITGLLDSFATACSFLLQYGVPLEVLIGKFKKTKFNPSGITNNPDIPLVDSILAYVFRFLEMRYLNTGTNTNETAEVDLSADLCPECGNPMKRTGTCLQCDNCGESHGVCS